MAWMYAVNDDDTVIEWKGDSGPLSSALWIATLEEADKNGWQHTVYNEKAYCVEHMATPRIGVVMQVGSPYGRSYSAQDYWTTTPVTEIVKEWIDDTGRKNVKFKTKNSTYWWRK